MRVELEHLVEERDIHDVYVQRYRATYLARDLWRIAQGRARWAMAAPARGSGSGGGFQVVGAGRAARPRYFDVTVPANAALDVPEHTLRIWAHDLRRGMESLQRDERDAWEDYLLWPRLSSVFHVVTRWAMVRRGDNASEELARATMKLVISCEVLE